MNQDVEFYTDKNRETWNEVIPKRQAIAKEW